MCINITRRLLNAALAGELDNTETMIQAQLGLRIPTQVEGVDSEILNPRSAWDDPKAYDSAAAKLRKLFQQHYRNSGFAALGIEEKFQAGRAKHQQASIT